jgi:hypothetical protein
LRVVLELQAKVMLVVQALVQTTQLAVAVAQGLLVLALQDCFQAMVVRA